MDHPCMPEVTAADYVSTSLAYPDTSLVTTHHLMSVIEITHEKCGVFFGYFKHMLLL